MKYPINNDALHELYCSHTGKEPEPETRELLGAVVGIVNQAYMEGVQEGMNRMKGS